MTNESEIISKFIDEMCSRGCDPARAADIKIAEPRGGKWPRYQLAGDRPRDTNGFYRLKIATLPNGELMGIGNFGTRRDNVAHKFSTKTDKKWTPEERAEWKRKRREDEARAAAETEALYSQAKAAALEVWRAAGPAAADHPYLMRKGVDGPGFPEIRQIGDELIIPMYADGALWNLQTITAEGDKFFSFRIGDGWSEGGRAAGCYTPIMGAVAGDMAVVLICEGYATGRSLRECTGLPVLVAFNSGNLRAVARYARQRYPEARLIICADNDQWRFLPTKRPKDVRASEVTGDDARWTEWRASGMLQNIGRELAHQAAGAAAGAWVIWPDIPENDGDKRTDFNDWHLSSGKDAVRNRVLQVLAQTPVHADDAGVDGGDVLPQGEPPHPVDAGYQDDGLEWAPPEIYEQFHGEMQRLYHPDVPVQARDWETELSYNDEGVLRGSSKNNARLMIENHRDYIGMLVYDEFAHEKVVARQPVWEVRTPDFKPRTLRDDDVTNLCMHLESKGLFPKFSDLAKIVDAVIKRYSRNPAKEYFARLNWDGVPRLDNWLRDICGCIEDDEEYLSAIGRKWLTAGVRRVRWPGCKMDHILILEGDQNIGKSTVFRELATIHGREYFDDTIKARDLADPKTVPKMQGVLIIELAEMTGFSRMSDSEAKQIISTQTDRIVRKYQNEATKMPRQFIMAGSLNPLEGYLTDTTGNRRYWPAKCGDKLNIELLRETKEQLWAEAAHYEARGEELYLKDELYRKAMKAQEDRMRVLPWQPDLERLCRERQMVRLEEIWGKLGLVERSKRTKAAAEDIAKIMTGMGFKYSRKRINGEREYAWCRTMAQHEMKIGDESVEQDNQPWHGAEEIEL